MNTEEFYKTILEKLQDAFDSYNFIFDTCKLVNPIRKDDIDFNLIDIPYETTIDDIFTQVRKYDTLLQNIESSAKIVDNQGQIHYGVNLSYYCQCDPSQRIVTVHCMIDDPRDTIGNVINLKSMTFGYMTQLL